MQTSATVVRPPSSKHGEHRVKRTRTAVDSLILFFVSIVAVIFVMSIVFRISDITVTGNTHYTDEEIIRAIDIEEGDNLFFYDRFATISRVFAKLPYVEEISVERNLPNKVHITVTECKALAYLVIGDEYWTMDHNCKILGKATDDELQELISVSGIQPGTLMIGETMTLSDGTTDRQEYLQEVLTQIQNYGYSSQVSRIFFDDSGRLTFTYGKNLQIVLGQYQEVKLKFALLQSALSQLLEGDCGTMDLSNTASVAFRPR